MPRPPRFQGILRQLSSGGVCRHGHGRPTHGLWRSRNTSLLAVALAATLVAPGARAQELPLKRDIPGTEPFRCTDTGAGKMPSDEERDQAARLGSNASQAVILGDQERARDLLARATELDPTSADLAYQYARILEELGDARTAVTQYCRVVAIDPQTVDAVDAQNRVDELTAASRPPPPADAAGAFRSGLSDADAGRLEAAVQAFGRAVASAPEWGDAVYDRGVLLARLDRREEAVQDLRRYLELTPDAPDGIAVSERIGQLQNAGVLPSPGTALGLGLLVPGMGQFYSGRTLGGLTVLTLVGGSVAAAFLIEDVKVKCLQNPGPDGTCPPEQVLGEEVDRPYLAPGLGIAAAVSVIGAIEAYVKLRGRRNAGAGLASIDVGRAKVGALGIARSRGRVDIRLVRVGF